MTDQDKLHELIDSIEACHTHPGKERMLNEGADSYSTRVKHNHVIIDLAAWKKVKKALFDLEYSWRISHD